MEDSVDSTSRHPLHLQNLFVMRHGQRLDDASRSWLLSAPRPWDPPLTDDGKHHARRTGRQLRSSQSSPITRVLCSPFLRCVQTASEVVTALCALDDDDCDSVAIDPSRVKVSIEYGLCEVMNTIAIRVPHMPPGGPTILDTKDLEALLPAGTVDASVGKVFTQPPKWLETLPHAYERYVQTFQAISDMFPKENILCVTHGEGVGVSVSHYGSDLKSDPKLDVDVHQVRYCAVSHVQRPIYDLRTPPDAGKFKLLTQSGEDSGIVFDLKPASRQ